MIARGPGLDGRRAHEAKAREFTDEEINNAEQGVIAAPILRAIRKNTV